MVNRMKGIVWINALKDIEIIGKILYLDGGSGCRFAVFAKFLG